MNVQLTASCLFDSRSLLLAPSVMWVWKTSQCSSFNLREEHGYIPESEADGLFALMVIELAFGEVHTPGQLRESNWSDTKVQMDLKDDCLILTLDIGCYCRRLAGFPPEMHHSTIFELPVSLSLISKYYLTSVTTPVRMIYLTCLYIVADNRKRTYWSNLLY